MKKFLLSSALALSFCSVAALASEMTGFVSDSMCGAKHTGAGGAKDTACAKKCIGGGSDPVLVTDGKVMKLDADSAAKVKPFAGQMVKVDGSAEGDTLKVTSVEAAPSK